MADLQAFDLDGQVAVVTGGNGGIGRAIALGLAGAGAKVAIWGRNSEKNAEALAALRAVGPPAVALQSTWPTGANCNQRWPPSRATSGQCPFWSTTRRSRPSAGS